MVFKEFAVDRPPAAKTVRNVMPERNSGFAEPPAEVNFLVAIECREIHQPSLQIFHLEADLLDPFECRFE